jgi:hypothetical protein
LQFSLFLSYDKVVRKFKILFSIVFLLIFVSFFSQKTFANDCSNNDYGQRCTSSISNCGSNGVYSAQDNFCTIMMGNAYPICCNPPSNSSTGTGGSSTGAICNDDTQCSDGNTCASSFYIGENNNATSVKFCEPKDYSSCKASIVNTSPTAVAPGTFGCTISLKKTTLTDNQCADGGPCLPIEPLSKFDLGTMEWTNGFCIPKPANCPVCQPGSDFIPNNGTCGDDKGKLTPPMIECCIKPGDICSPGYGCSPDTTVPPTSACPGGECQTALGPLSTDPLKLITRIFSIVLAIAGIAALSLIIASGYRLMVSQGNPEQVKGAREQLTAAIIGLLFIIFSLVILQVIGANILSIPGFN